ncbi:MAG: hypothetical protein KBA51_01750 [Kiritimatiellae bacterium]|nr:hypothetical protein [Kiritimatiellia bacterium]
MKLSQCSFWARMMACAVGLASIAGCDSGGSDDGGTVDAADTAEDAGGGAATPASLDGSWVGTIKQGANPAANVSMSITQTGDSLSGTFNGTGGFSGPMTGTLSGDSVSMTTTTGPVVAQWNGTANTSRTSMSGNFTIVAGGGGSGTWALSK